jgi:integral membrane protein
VSIATALRNYRVAAWVTGTGLLVLMFVWLVWEPLTGDDRPTAYAGMTHGFLYMAYIVCTLILAERCRWRPVDALVILLAGTIPVASFVAERQVTRRVREGKPVLGKDGSATSSR